MAVAAGAVGISPASECRQCSRSAILLRPQHMQLSRQARWPSSFESAASFRCRFMGPTSSGAARTARAAQHTQVASALGPAIGGAQPSLRADTALCFASDSVSEPISMSDPNQNPVSEPVLNPVVSEAAPEASQRGGAPASDAVGFPARDLRVLWDSVSRPLLRVGRAGEP